MLGIHRKSSLWPVVSGLERIAALGVLVALAPLLLIVAIAITLLSRTSPLIAHRRLGLGGAPFWVLKFRTMWPRGARRVGRFTLIEYIVDESGPRKKGYRDQPYFKPLRAFLPAAFDRRTAPASARRTG